MKAIVPHIGRDYIDQKAEEVLSFFSPECLKYGNPPPIYDIVHGLQQQFAIPFSFDSDLGTRNGKKVLGRFDFSPRSIHVDKALPYDSPRFRWTLCHEIGHLVLHRTLAKNGAVISQDQRLVDTRTELRFGTKSTYSDAQWVEWQASQFASSMLLPRSPLFARLVSFQETELQIRNKGNIYVDDNARNIANYLKTINHLHMLFQTSKTILIRRLRSLGILQDNRHETRGRLRNVMKSLFDTD